MPVAQHIAIEDPQESQFAGHKLDLADLHFDYVQVSAVDRPLVVRAVRRDRAAA